MTDDSQSESRPTGYSDLTVMTRPGPATCRYGQITGTRAPPQSGLGLRIIGGKMRLAAIAAESEDSNIIRAGRVGPGGEAEGASNAQPRKRQPEGAIPESVKALSLVA